MFSNCRCIEAADLRKVYRSTPNIPLCKTNVLSFLRRKSHKIYWTKIAQKIQNLELIVSFLIYCRDKHVEQIVWTKYSLIFNTASARVVPTLSFLYRERKNRHKGRSYSCQAGCTQEEAACRSLYASASAFSIENVQPLTNSSRRCVVNQCKLCSDDLFAMFVSPTYQKTDDQLQILNFFCFFRSIDFLRFTPQKRK